MTTATRALLQERITETAGSFHLATEEELREMLMAGTFAPDMMEEFLRHAVMVDPGEKGATDGMLTMALLYAQELAVRDLFDIEDTEATIDEKKLPERYHLFITHLKRVAKNTPIAMVQESYYGKTGMGIESAKRGWRVPSVILAWKAIGLAVRPFGDGQ